MYLIKTLLAQLVVIMLAAIVTQVDPTPNPDPLGNFLNGFALAGIPLLILVPLIVQGLKRIGMDEKFTGPASILVSGACAIAIYLVDAWPNISPVITLIVMAIVLGLSGSGGYSQQKMLRFGKPIYPNDPKDEPRLLALVKRKGLSR